MDNGNYRIGIETFRKMYPCFAHDHLVITEEIHGCYYVHMVMYSYLLSVLVCWGRHRTRLAPDKEFRQDYCVQNPVMTIHRFGDQIFPFALDIVPDRIF